MRNFFAFTVLLAFSFCTAQKHEIGLFLGGTNAISDIGRTDFINPMPKRVNGGFNFPINIGALYRFNLNPQHSLRFNLGIAGFGDSDVNAVEDYRKERRAAYVNNIIEFSSVFEYNFFPINSEQKNAHSPYIFAGVGAYATNAYTYNVYHQFQRDKAGVIVPNATDFDTSLQTKKEKRFGYTLPFGAGYKYKFNYDFVISAEVGFRPAFTDNLDLAYPEEKDFQFFIEDGLTNTSNALYFSEEAILERNKEIIKKHQLGNSSSKDWYVFTGLTLTYTFGRPPCFCD